MHFTTLVTLVTALIPTATAPISWDWCPSWAQLQKSCWVFQQTQGQNDVRTLWPRSSDRADSFIPLLPQRACQTRTGNITDPPPRTLYYRFVSASIGAPGYIAVFKVKAGKLTYRSNVVGLREPFVKHLLAGEGQRCKLIAQSLVWLIDYLVLGDDKTRWEVRIAFVP